MPPCASGPVFTVSRPTFNDAACAIAGAGKRPSATAAPAAVPAKSVRRETFREVALRNIMSSHAANGFRNCGASAGGCFIRSFFLWRNDWQQQIGPRRAAEMQAGDAAENLRRPVAHIVVQEWATARQFVL